MTSGPRAAKLKANKKLDAQAKALAEFQRENAIVTRSARPKRRAGRDDDAGSSPSRPSRGTRVSSRLRRGKPDPEEEWQSIPDEWLTEDNSEPPPRRSTRASKPSALPPHDTDSESNLGDPKHIKTGLESDGSVSDLTDLSSDHGPHDDSLSAEDDDGDGNECKSDPPLGERHDIKLDDSLEEFIEWEMVWSLTYSLLARTVLTRPHRSVPPFQNGNASPSDLRMPPTTPRKGFINFSRITYLPLLWPICRWVRPPACAFPCR